MVLIYNAISWNHSLSFNIFSNFWFVVRIGTLESLIFHEISVFIFHEICVFFPLFQVGVLFHCVTPFFLAVK